VIKIINLNQYINRNSNKNSIVLSSIEETFIIYDLDLSPIEELLKSLYSSDPRGRKPRDPVCMFRSFVLMVLYGETSITKWSKKLRTDEFLSTIAGWEFGKSPGVATFYKFLDRLQDGPYQKKCCHIQALSKLDKGWHIRNFKEEKRKKKEKYYLKSDSNTQKLTATLLSNSETTRQNDLLKRLEDILMELAVKPSIEKGLINPKQLEISGDGSTICSGANKNGKYLCSCLKEKNLRKCDCDRLYTDPDADWGYDHYRDKFYYGDTFYQLCYSSKGHDLPLHILCGPASETDYTLSLKSFDRFLKTLREHNIQYKIPAAIFDAGHDALGVYFYFRHKQIPTVIPLNNRRARNTYKNTVKLNDKGIPICKGGKQMRHIGYNKNKMRHQFGCPVKRMTHKNGKAIYITHPEECPFDTLCEPEATVAPVISIYSKDNPRLFPDIPRSLKKFKKLYKFRTGTERSNSVKKDAYPIERARIKSRAHRLIRLYIISIIEHRKAIYKEETRGLSREQILEILKDKIENSE